MIDCLTTHILHLKKLFGESAILSDASRIIFILSLSFGALEETILKEIQKLFFSFNFYTSLVHGII